MSELYAKANSSLYLLICIPRAALFAAESNRDSKHADVVRDALWGDEVRQTQKRRRRLTGLLECKIPTEVNCDPQNEQTSGAEHAAM